MEEKEGYIWLSNLQISNKNKFKLLEKFGGILNLYYCSLDELAYFGINDNMIFKILNKDLKEKSKKDFDYMQKNNIDIIWYGNELYPKKLKEIPDKPICFYIRGNKNILNNKSIGIVGSRKAFISSMNFTKEISKRLSINRNKYHKWFSKRSGQICSFRLS